MNAGGEMKEHPLQRFWIEESGWHDKQSPIPELGMSEGKLCIDAWNAAIRAAYECVNVDGNPEPAKEKIARLLYSGPTY